MSEEMEQIVVRKKDYNKLIKKYPGAKKAIDDEVDYWCDYYNKHPFEEKEKEKWINSIKDNLVLFNQKYKEKDNIKKISKEEEEISEENYKEMMKEAYNLIIKMLKKYCDLNEDYYNLIACWIIGTYFHDKFKTYPYLFIHATKGSGKSRTMNLTTHLSHEGRMVNSLTEAVLFRTTGTLGIDEFESLGRKGSENLRELLNSAYKQGITIIRMSKQKKEGVEDHVPTEYRVYRPIIIANISGMDEVLEDRCLTLIMEKSAKTKIINLIENFDGEKDIQKIKDLCSKCSKCSFFDPSLMFAKWNNFIFFEGTQLNTNSIKHTNNTNNTYYTHLFEKVKFTGIGGRNLELFLPLIIIANEISSVVTDKTTLSLQKLHLSKKEDEFSENTDVSLIDFISQEPPKNAFVSLKETTQNFQKFIKNTEYWLNTKWMGRALKRLGLVKEKRRRSYGVEYILNYEKAQEKIKMFK